MGGFFTKSNFKLDAVVGAHLAFALLTLLLAERVLAAEIHYAPTESLEQYDVALLGRAQKTIDIAAYVLSDRPVIEALVAAGGRGVQVRVYVDGSEAGHDGMAPDTPFGTLLAAPNVTVKQKHPGRPIMHLKSACVDGRWFRTGSANFTKSGLKAQDNDLVIADDPAMCAAFETDFERIWNGLDAE